MVKNAIKVYARVKPEKNRKNVLNYQIHHRPKENVEEDFLFLVTPSQKTKEYPDNRAESWNFSFYRIFEESTTQEDVFKTVAQPVVESALDGYNGTIFAYGQTASGKTYSITGRRESVEQLGILPRTLLHLFEAIEKRPENVYSVEVAYLEIYNENGYDLLDRKLREVTRLEDLPRVVVQEDEIGRLHLKNLTFHCVASAEDAFELLAVGDGNRVTVETPMNPESSRSHCVFTIVVCTKEFGADEYKRAKIHLVDLAGSERVYKCSISGTILTEAKHINLSLHYLEQVIVCLGQESAGHIPYRNSLLTSILRDSLGGNCLTTMLATMSIASFNLEETLSTCRFAQRVALIRNDVKLVLEKDVNSENALLKLENEKLRRQIKEMTKNTELTAEDKRNLDSQIRNFLEADGQVEVGNNVKKIEYCFESFRRVFKLNKDKNGCLKKLEYYKDLVIQRDKEISLLIDLMKKGKEDSTEKNLENLKPVPKTVQTTDSSDIDVDKIKLNLECNGLNNPPSETSKIAIDKFLTAIPKKPRPKIKLPKCLDQNIDTNVRTADSDQITIRSICNDISRPNLPCNVINLTLNSTDEPSQQSFRKKEREKARREIEAPKKKSEVKQSVEPSRSNDSEERIENLDTDIPLHQRFFNLKGSMTENLSGRKFEKGKREVEGLRKKSEVKQSMESSGSTISSESKEGTEILDTDTPFYQKFLNFNVPKISNASMVENLSGRKCEKEKKEIEGLRKKSEVKQSTEPSRTPISSESKERTEILDTDAPFYQRFLNSNASKPSMTENLAGRKSESAKKEIEAPKKKFEGKQNTEPSETPISSELEKKTEILATDTRFYQKFLNFNVPKISSPSITQNLTERKSQSAPKIESTDCKLSRINSQQDYKINPNEDSIDLKFLERPDRRRENVDIDHVTHTKVGSNLRDIGLPHRNEVENEAKESHSRMCSSDKIDRKTSEKRTSISSFNTEKCERTKIMKEVNEAANYEKCFTDSLPLTGDPEIDEEIIAFYKAKRSGGTY
nr:PREDICTED: kinesin-1 heavy chain-like [Megachile rotundata]